MKNYDYSQSGLYFVTICAQNRECLFGNIVGAIHESPLPKMVLNDIGKIIDSVFKTLPDRFPVILDAFQIMPNHVHMVIQIVGVHHDAPIIVGAHHDAPIIVGAIHESPLRKRSLLSQIIGYFKMNSAKSIHQINPNIPVWQRNYYEHIIRNEQSLEKIRNYIDSNPKMWERDRNNPLNAKRRLPKEEL